jgi:hypothetical protein
MENGIRITSSFWISEKDITAFCGGCEYLGSDNVCPILGKERQASCAHTKLCDWAKNDGIVGTMTSEGFQAI